MATVRIFGINGSTNPAEDFRLAASGLFVPASPLNNRTGVTSTPVLTGTGSFTCTVGPFCCLIDGTSNAMQGSYWAALDSAATVTINAPSAQARIDLISLQIQDNDYDGSSQHRGQILYTAGTPGSGSAPTPPANSISLWTVPVPVGAGSINFGAATAQFPYTAAAGGIIPVRSAADQPAVAAAVQYRHRLDVAAAAGGASPLESSTDGVTWHPVFDPSVVPASTLSAISGSAGYGTWTNCTVNTPTFSITNQPQYRTAPGGRIELRGTLFLSGTIPGGSTNVIGNLPAPAVVRNIPIACTLGNVYLALPASGTTATLQAAGSISGPVTIGFDGLSYTL